MKRTGLHKVTTREPFVILVWHIDYFRFSVIVSQLLDNSLENRMISVSGYECNISHYSFFTIFAIVDVHTKGDTVKQYPAGEMAFRFMYKPIRAVINLKIRILS